MLKTLTAAALTLTALAGATSTSAVAGDNSCVGYVSAGQIVDDGWSLPPSGVCTFSPTSKVGKIILAKCPVGTTCRVELPLEANSRPITTTRVRIEKVCDGHCAPYTEEELRPFRECEAKGLRYLPYYGGCHD